MKKPTAAHAEQRSPSIEALRAIMTLAECDGISETARRLNVSQPVITKKLQVFKNPQACGAVLLRSNKGRVHLTDAAKAAIPTIREVVSRYDHLMEFLRGDKVAPKALRVGTGSFHAEYFLPQAIARLRSTHVECQIETHVCRGRDRVLGVASGVLDLAVVTLDREQIKQVLRVERRDEDVLRIVQLGQHRVGLLASPDSDCGRELKELPESRSVPISNLTQWELVGPDRQSGIRRQLESKANGPLYFVVEGGGWEAAKQYARLGLGVAIVPMATIKPGDEQQFICRRLSNQYVINDVIVVRDEESDPYQQQLIAEIKNAVGR